MILKRDWSARDLGRRAVFANAMKGLSPFEMLDLMEEDVAIMYKLDNDLKSALLVTTSDVRAAQAKVQVKVPESPGIHHHAARLHKFGVCPLQQQMPIVQGAGQDDEDTPHVFSKHPGKYVTRDKSKRPLDHPATI